VEQHSLRLVPGALSLAREPSRPAGESPAGGWLGVGDPIYNSADSRWITKRGYSGWFANAAPMGQLNRLVASGDELRSSARSWGSASEILEGVDATREKFVDSAHNRPSVIHLATHVLASPDRPGQSLIAFGLDSSGDPQFMTTADVAMMHVPGTVIAMTGCATGAGEIRPGAGLLGMTTAWQMAGASAVVATLWPVPDSQGELFVSFYHYLRNMPAGEALRQSQIDTVRSGTWRASPRYWASYQVTGGAR
jgi:CHAT domain-containing protein